MQPTASSPTFSSLPHAAATPGPALQPSARFGDGIGDITSAVLSPDGQTVYFGVISDALRPGLLLDAIATYLSGFSAILGVLILIVAARRINNRPQVTSKHYCRKCNYELTPATAQAACPECGQPLARRPPRRGRAKFLRILPPLAACGALLILACALLLSPAWSGPALGLLGLDVITPPQFILDSVRPAIRKQTIDMGERLYSAPSRGGAPAPIRLTPRSFTTLAIAPDGASIFAGTLTESLWQIDLSTGRRLRRAPLDRYMWIDVGAANILGFTPDARGAYVQWTTDTVRGGAKVPVQGSCGVSLWDLNSNTATEVFSAVPWKDPASTFNPSQPGPFWLISSHPDWHFIQTPSFLQAFTTKTWQPATYTPTRTQTLPALAEIDPSGTPAVSAKAGLVFVTSGYGRAINAISVTDGTIRSQITPTSALARFGDTLAFWKSRQWLAASDSHRSIHIRDINTSQWLVTLLLPDDCYAPKMCFSADGSSLAAVVQRNITPPSATTNPLPGSPPPRTTTHDLVVWDLRSLPAPESAPTH